MQLFKFLNSNSVDMGFRILLFQTQFSSQEFHEFSLIWAFNDVTSSAHYAKANSKAESSVKTVKQLFNPEYSFTVQIQRLWYETLIKALGSVRD